jgi:hypothetical protein
MLKSEFENFKRKKMRGIPGDVSPVASHLK